MPETPLKLKWEKPENENNDPGMPIGNGYFGGKIKGGIGRQYVDLNDITFCSKGPSENQDPRRREAMLETRKHLAAGVAEMLFQSHLGEINLLPAFPFKKWPTGSVTGLRARGGFEVDVAWKDGRLTGATLRNVLTLPLTGQVRSGDKVATVKLKPGESVKLNASLN